MVTLCMDSELRCVRVDVVEPTLDRVEVLEGRLDSGIALGL